MLLSHWCKLIDGLRASPQEFYKALDDALLRRQVPALIRSRVLWPEGGLLSANREYTRYSREKLLFDICAAPFGAGFFVSCRLATREIPWFLICMVLMAGFLGLMCLWLLVVAAAQGVLAAIAMGAVVLPTVIVSFAIVGVVLWVLRGCLRNLDQMLSGSVVLGPLYERITGRNTYYRIDIMLSFQAAVQAAVMEVIDQHIQGQGLTPLSDSDRKPVFNKLLLR